MLLVFIVISLTQMLLGSSICGYYMLGEAVVWKLILRKVHCPCTESDALFIVETWKGMKVVAEFGISTAFLLTSRPD